MGAAGILSAAMQKRLDNKQYRPSASAIRTRGMVASGKHEVFSDPVAGQRMN